MDLIRALRFDQISRCPKVAFVGSGGKTSAIFQCAREYNRPVLVTATTHLAVDQIALADQHFFADAISELKERIPPGVTLITGRIQNDTNRTSGVTTAQLALIQALADANEIPLLIEADGSRQRPLKAPAGHEPPIPEFVDAVVVLAGLSGLEQELTEETVHRPEIFSEITSLQIGNRITPKALNQVLMHPTGGLKNIPAQAQRRIMLNQADTHRLQALATGMSRNLLEGYDGVLVTAFHPQFHIHAVHEPIAGVILAAGESTRFGETKQLLDWHGRPLVWHVAQQALRAGLEPVIVVCGEDIDRVEQALQGLRVKLIHNPNWQHGQGSSVRVGTAAVSKKNGGILFLLADQPQISVQLLHTLIIKHAQTLAPICGPLVDGQRGNPVLFDAQTFPDLMELSGEKGGRKLFSKYPVHWVPWHDATPLLDVDTPADYARLLELKP